MQVFVGGTAGIGAALAVKTAKYSTNPNIHIVGRSKASAEKVLAELKAANKEGKYEFHEYVNPYPLSPYRSIESCAKM